MAEAGHYRDIAAAQLRVDDEDQPASPLSHMDRVQDIGLVTAISHAAKEKEKELL